MNNERVIVDLNLQRIELIKEGLLIVKKVELVKLGLVRLLPQRVVVCSTEDKVVWRELDVVWIETIERLSTHINDSQ
jgi:hypothetical protein